MIYDNSPAIGWVRITEAVAQYNGKMYVIPADATNKKYIYWDANIPYRYTFTDIVEVESDNKRLILINDNGQSTIVHSKTENYSITFESTPREVYTRKIEALYEKTKQDGKEVGSRFSSINQRLGTIETTAGETNNLVNGLETKITNLRQTSDGLSLQIEKTNKIFKNEKIKDDLSNAFLDYIVANGSFSKLFQKVTFEGLLPTESSSDLVNSFKERKEKRDVLFTKIEAIKEDLPNGVFDKDILPLLNSLKTELSATNDSLNSMLQDFIRKNKVDSEEKTRFNEILQRDLSILSMKQRSIEEKIAINTGGNVNSNLTKIILSNDGLDLRFSELKNGVEEKYSQLTSNINIFKSELGDNINQKFTTLKQSTDGISARVEDLKNKTNTSISLLQSGLETKVEKDGLNSLIKTTVEGTTFSFGGTLSSLNNKVDNTKRDINNLSNKVDDAKSDINTLSNAVTTINREGLTVLGGYVATDRLTVPTGHDPIIKLYGSGWSYGSPSIDATYYDNTGKGTYIRFKWDDNNYLRIGDNWYGRDTPVSEFRVFLKDEDVTSRGVFTIRKRYEKLENSSNWKELLDITSQNTHGSGDDRYVYVAELDGKALATIDYVKKK